MPIASRGAIYFNISRILGGSYYRLKYNVAYDSLFSLTLYEYLYSVI